MQRGATIRSRFGATLVVGAAVALLGLLLRDPRWRPGEQFLFASYDSLHSISGPREVALSNSPVVVIYLDLPSFLHARLDPVQPWPREIHAQLLQRLRTAGARAVVFDIVFSHPGANAEADTEFAAALREHGRVVLAAEFSSKSTLATDGQHERALVRTMQSVHQPFARAAAGVGIASLAIDRDRSVRRFMAGFANLQQPALAWAAALALGQPVAQSDGAMQAANQHWIRYYGPPLAIPHVSYSQVLDPGGVPDDFFRDKIIFIGSRPVVGGINDRLDEFGNPFDFWRNKELFMPGVEVHATQLLNAMNGDWLQRLPPGREVFLCLLAAIFGGALVWLRPVPATMVAALGAGVALGLAVIGFDHGTWFPWLIVCGVQMPAALAGSVLYSSLEWYRARQRFEAAKRLADAKIREQAALIDKAHDAILVADLAGNFLHVNPSAEKLYGWNAREFQSNERAGEIFLPDVEAANLARRAALESGEWNGELRQQTKAGALVTVASRWTLIRDEAGQPKALLQINSDITERKLLEQQFLRTQRLNTIGTLAGGMAHDLNNALAPVLLGAQLLRRKTADHESRELLSLIETSAHRGAEMVRQVLLFARGRGGEFEQLALAPVVKELEKMVRETFPKNIVAEKFLPADLWPVRGNATQLHQVLLNLCVNARDAMPAGGRLTLAADNVVLTAAEAAAIPEGRAGEFVSLLIADSGTGMPPEVLAQIFEPFFSTKDEGRGTGIGLATALRLVKAHEGFLRVESTPGEGTTFEIFLPRAADTAPAAPAVTVEIPRGRGELILVVDDERAVRELVSDGLTAQGYRTLTAAGGEEALPLFHRHRGEIRLLLTDSAMPLGDGPQLIAAVRSEQPDLPVIVASADAGPAGQASEQRTCFLQKPFALEDLLATVARSLGK